VIFECFDGIHDACFCSKGSIFGFPVPSGGKPNLVNISVRGRRPGKYAYPPVITPLTAYRSLGNRLFGGDLGVILGRLEDGGLRASDKGILSCRFAILIRPPCGDCNIWRRVFGVERCYARIEAAEQLASKGELRAALIGKVAVLWVRRLAGSRRAREPGGLVQARDALAAARADVYGENVHLAYRIADELPGATVLDGRFNLVQMSIAVQKNNAAVLSIVNDLVSEAKRNGSIAGRLRAPGLGVRPAP
jgi:hypothetical protein